MPVLYKRGRWETTRVTMIAPDYISPNPDQPRRYFDPEGLRELSDSIRVHGILQPLSVRRKGGGRYELIAGERRLRAAMICGLTEVPCLVMEVDRENSCVLSLIENLQRRDLDFWEEAKALERLICLYGLSQEEAAARLGKAQSTIANKLRLLKFSDAERNLLIKGNIAERQARALVRIDDQKLRVHALGEMIVNRLSIEQSEKLVEDLLNGAPVTKSAVKKEKTANRERKFTFPVPRLYINSINKIVKTMKEANIDCETVMNQVGDCYEYTIKIHSAVGI